MAYIFKWLYDRIKFLYFILKSKSSITLCIFYLIEVQHILGGFSSFGKNYYYREEPNTKWTLNKDCYKTKFPCF